MNDHNYKPRLQVNAAPAQRPMNRAGPGHCAHMIEVKPELNMPTFRKQGKTIGLKL